MAELKAGSATGPRSRPLSPHLQIYRPMLTMVMSIVHRITGVALYLGTVLLAAWLVSAAMGPAEFAFVNGLFAHPLGLLVLLGYSWALIHHMLGGVRHLCQLLEARESLCLSDASGRDGHGGCADEEHVHLAHQVLGALDVVVPQP